MKLAIVSLSTFGYFERMAIAASRRGIETEFFDERPANDVFTKLFLRFAPKGFVRSILGRHVMEQRQKIVDGGFTHVLFVFAEAFSADDIRFLCEAGLRVCRFTWDSVQNRPSVTKLDPLMHAIASFDPDDCAAYGYSYIPLYSEVIRPEGMLEMNQRQFDFYFCGTTHSDRAMLLNSMMTISKRRGWRTNFKLFFHSRLLYALRYWRDRRAMALFDQISTIPFSHAETIEDSRNARVVVDIHHPKQSGLTMRSFEALAQGAVLLTTNAQAATLIEPSLTERVVFLDRRRLEASMMEALARCGGPLELGQYEKLSQDRFLTQIFDLLGITVDGDPA